MISYNEIYEVLRKEKYAEGLQVLPKGFVEDFCVFLEEKRKEDFGEGSGLLDSGSVSKKEMENAIALFKELILRRKRKLLNLVFVATETGIMKRDYENMLGFEKVVFDKFVKAFEEGDKELNKVLNGRKDDTERGNKMILFKQSVEEFVDMEGGILGPYKEGELANLDSGVAGILVGDGKAGYVDE